MKYLGFSLMISLIAGGLGAQVAPKLKVKQIFLEYKSPNKTIEIKDTSIVLERSRRLVVFSQLPDI